MLNKIMIIVIALAVLIGGFYALNDYIYEEKQGEQTFCTADAMMCPDGTYVGRTGPNCEFVCPN